jgi:hypothetical protein
VVVGAACVLGTQSGHVVVVLVVVVPSGMVTLVFGMQSTQMVVVVVLAGTVTFSVVLVVGWTHGPADSLNVGQSSAVMTMVCWDVPDSSIVKPPWNGCSIPPSTTRTASP